MVSIRSWMQADIDYVMESVKREGWGYTRRDIERCWQYEPNGCFIAEDQNKSIGHVFSICYGKMGWIGLLIVNPEKRERGVGAILMHTAISYLQRAGVETIRLEAVEKAVALYKHLGFREEFDTLRLSKQLKGKEELEHRVGEKIFPMKEEDIENIAKFDSKYFGANRLRVLWSLYKDQPQHCFVARENQRILGYLMSRKIPNAHLIGPWVCGKPDKAEELLNAYINSMEEGKIELRLGMPVPNINGARLIEKLGFQVTRKRLRMIRGENKHQGDIAGIYGIGGSEKG